MRKRIGLFIGEISQDYQHLISNEIIKVANPLGYDVVVIASYGSYTEDYLYAEGEKSVISLPSLRTFDGIIITEDIFDIIDMPDLLYDVVMKDANCPVVYLRTTRDGCYCILPENTKSMSSIVEHFIDIHGFSDICYMSGKKGAEDAKERLEGYLSTMKKHNLPVTEHMIYHGDYWRNKGKEAIDWFMKDRENYPEAIVCANDYMALSIIDELRARGISVPEDVSVSGFDFLDEAKMNIPSLTSLEVDFLGMASRAVEIIDRVNKGKKEPHIHSISAKLRLHRSCGCGEQFKYKDIIGLLKKNNSLVEDTKNTLISVTEYQYSFSFDEFMNVADRYRRFLRTRKAYICLNDTNEQGYDEVENNGKFTLNMRLKRIFEENHPAITTDILFPRERLLPDSYWSDNKPNNFCIFPVHCKNIVYGYVVSEISDGMWFDIFTQGYFMLLANAIESSGLHHQLEDLESIRTLYQNDALTGILNRRGFDKNLQERFSLSKTVDSPFAIASIDMDNLKIINDTYGHSIGDKALVALANAISDSLEEGECCARIGGDEFAAILNISSPTRCRSFKKVLSKILKGVSLGEDFKMSVEASVGICESCETDSMIECIHLADKRMYEEKRRHKNKAN